MIAHTATLHASVTRPVLVVGNRSIEKMFACIYQVFSSAQLPVRTNQDKGQREQATLLVEDRAHVYQGRHVCYILVPILLQRFGIRLHRGAALRVHGDGGGRRRDAADRHRVRARVDEERQRPRAGVRAGDAMGEVSGHVQ